MFTSDWDSPSKQSSIIFNTESTTKHCRVGSYCIEYHCNQLGNLSHSLTVTIYSTIFNNIISK